MFAFRSAAFVALAALTSGNALAAGAPAMMTLPQHQAFEAVRRYVAAFNAGDTKTEVSLCASPAAIVDEIAPHRWNGPTACADWTRALHAANGAAGIADENVTLLLPKHVDVDGDSAYVVVPATYTYRQHGTPSREPGIWTFALENAGGDWKIAAWAWSAQ